VALPGADRPADFADHLEYGDLATKLALVVGRENLAAQGARLFELRRVSDVATFAFPGGVSSSAAGARHASGPHVSRQQPVAARTAIRLRLSERDAVVVSINSHDHHADRFRAPTADRMPDRYGLVSRCGRVGYRIAINNARPQDITTGRGRLDRTCTAGRRGRYPVRKRQS
jgi:hypothetical protein